METRLGRPVSFKKLHKAKLTRDSEADDLPDITPSIMKKAAELWKVDHHSNELPIRRFIHAFRVHYDVINPYFSVLQETNGNWYQHWSYLYEIAQQLEHAVNAEKIDRYYSVPLHLEKRRAEIHNNALQAKLDYENEYNKYQDEVSKRQLEIVEIQKTINLIAEAKGLDTLSAYDHPAMKPAASSDKSGFGAVILSLFKRTPKPVATPATVNEKDNQFRVLRDRLLVEYNANLRIKNEELEEYVNYSAPKKSERYEREEEDTLADIRHHKLEFYRWQTPDVMLHCLRLYEWATKSYVAIYGSEPLEEPDVRQKEASREINNFSDATAAKARQMFRQMMLGMKSNLDGYYCRQPDRVSFEVYRQHFNAIKEREVRQAILTNGAKPATLNLIFRDFESPTELISTPKIGL